MNIGFDVDGVLADFNSSFIDQIVAQTGVDRFPKRPFDIQMWHYPQHYGYSSEEVGSFWRGLENENQFWARLEPYPETLYVLGQLYRLAQKGHNIYFITARPGWFAKRQTEQWLSSYGFPLPTVLLSDRKGMSVNALKLDFYIDDKTENVQDVDSANSDIHHLYLLDRPWNHDAGPLRATRVMSATDALRLTGF